MKIAVFDTHKYDRDALEAANNNQHELHFFEARLNQQTAALAMNCDAVCCFANDRADAATLKLLKSLGIKLIALRCAGYNQVDLNCAHSLDISVVRVPEYSPHAVAEFAVGLLLTLNRKIHRAHNRVREMNFSLEGLVGFDLYNKNVGIIGTGKIGQIFAQIMRGFGCNVLAYDKYPSLEWASKNNIQYVKLNNLFQESDVISLHIPLNDETRYLINESALRTMKKESIVINTGRGALIDTRALVTALKGHQIGGACLDVYEEESGVFFSDLSEFGIDDDQLSRLLTFPNVLVTSHQGFLTHEALKNIATTTIESLSRFENNQDLTKVLVSV